MPGLQQGQAWISIQLHSGLSGVDDCSGNTWWSEDLMMAESKERKHLMQKYLAIVISD